jgi:hypothetical protein
VSVYECKGGAEVGTDWANKLVLHEHDAEWHHDPLQDESDPFEAKLERSDAETGDIK